MEASVYNSTRLRNSSDPKSLARKPKSTIEALGQVMTSPGLAKEMIYGLGVHAETNGSRLLDPCVGPATFIKALKEVNPSSKIGIDAYDLDPAMVDITRTWSKKYHRQASVSELDYLEIPFNTTYDYAILNPPYVRQEWIEKKDHYRDIFKKRYGVEISGTSNLYVYFIVKVMADLKVNGQMACVVYDSWQSTRFGQWLSAHLHAVCSKLRVEPAPPLPFRGCLIDATIIYAKKGANGGTGSPQLSLPIGDKFTASIPTMTPIKGMYSTKRGLRLKQADFFMTHIENSGKEGATPFVRKVNSIHGYRVPDGHHEAALLLSEREGNGRTIREIERRLDSAKSDPKGNISILTWHRERPESWARHRIAERAPIIFNYYLRRRPRHIYNPSRPFSDNFYGLTPLEPTPVLALLAAMNSTASTIGILEQARNQGAGLAKLQLYEYRQARVVDISKWSKAETNKIATLGKALADGKGNPEAIISAIDDVVSVVAGDARLKPRNLKTALREVDERARRPKG